MNTKHPHSLHPSAFSLQPSARRAAFTLVEMLVSTAIVLIMLLLFAQIFGTAVSTMRTQQGVAQNDQRARALETTLRNDLLKATYRQPRSKGVYGLVPLVANGPVDAARQRGFFYISENELQDGTDDVLHFTIDVRQNHREIAAAALKGRAATLEATPGFSPGAAAADLNQPDYDDGVFGDTVGQSHCAEVAYFLRGGNLYRRVLLLREPPAPTIDGSPAEFSAQPGLGPLGAVEPTPGTIVDRKFTRDSGGTPITTDYLPALVGSGSGNFWNDFDYSAWNWWHDEDGDEARSAIGGAGADEYWLMFNGVDSLVNTPGGSAFPIADPRHRFGHFPRASEGLPDTNVLRQLAGRPMEYLLTPGPAFTAVGFIGRFTHEETSSAVPASAVRFAYPGLVPEDGVTGVVNPMLPVYNADWDINNNNQIVDVFEFGPRIGEDILLSGVESFDIEVWDEGFAESDLNGDGIVTTGAGSYEDRNQNGAVDTLSSIWVNLGHGGVHPDSPAPGGFGVTGLGYYRQLSAVGNATHGNLNPNYGPRVVGAGIFNSNFDTWHPDAVVGDASVLTLTAPQVLYPYQQTGPNKPPHQPLRIPIVVGGTATGTQWVPGAEVTYGVVVFPGVEDLDDDGEQDDPGGANDEDHNGNGILDPGDPSFYYIPVQLAEDINGNRQIDSADGDDGDGDGTLEGITGATEPEWPREPGATVVDGGVTWQCFDNRIGLQMIRLTIRYRDVKSGLPRQVSIVHSFVE